MDQSVEIGFLAQISRIDVQACIGIGAGQPNLPARDRSDDSRCDGVSVDRYVEIGQGRGLVHEQRLMVGPDQARIGLCEQMRLQNIVARRGNRPLGFMDDEGQEMILQVLADAW
jgi:hypothetical protein